MNQLSIFVASSSEGEKIANKLLSRLQAELDANNTSAKVESWRKKFPYSETAIESLEVVANEVDFAVVVMTPDDITFSRQKKVVTPRDNLVFELGLFIGALGRDRSIIAREIPRKTGHRKQELKLPSDILGMTVLMYDAKSGRDLKTSLQTACVKLAGQIKKLGPRPKWLAEGRAVLAANKDFRRQIEGAWWEKVNYPGGSVLSFFTISADPLGNVVLEGISHGEDGNLRAKWKSEMARLYPADRKIAYLWRGKRQVPGFANLYFHGYGTMEFNPPEGSPPEIVQGSGDFWDVDEAQPEKTISKSLELRRVLDKNDKRIMTKGSAAKKQEVVLRVIKAW